MEIMEYIIEKSLVIVPALWIIGTFLKHTPRIPDWIIPWILLVFGVAANIMMLGINVEALVQGVLVAGAAVLGHQLMKQTSHR